MMPKRTHTKRRVSEDLTPPALYDPEETLHRSLNEAKGDAHTPARFDSAEFDPVSAYAYEAMLHRAKNLPRLSGRQVAQLLETIKDGAEEEGREAAGVLLDHHLYWLVFLLRGHKMVGAAVMDDPNSNREDLLQEAALMFVHACGKFLPEKVERKEGQSEDGYYEAYHSVFLAYAQWWIFKRVYEVQSVSLYDLEQSVARRQMLVRQAEAELSEELRGGTPTAEEISARLMEQACHRMQEEKGIAPTAANKRRFARKYGWLPAADVRDLLMFGNQKCSLDRPLGDSQKLKLADVLADEQADDVDARLDANRVLPLVGTLLRSAPLTMEPGRAEAAFLSRMGVAFLEERSWAEVARLVGVASDGTAARYGEGVTRALVGEMPLRETTRGASEDDEEGHSAALLLYPHWRKNVRRAFGRDH